MWYRIWIRQFIISSLVFGETVAEASQVMVFLLFLRTYGVADTVQSRDEPINLSVISMLSNPLESISNGMLISW